MDEKRRGLAELFGDLFLIERRLEQLGNKNLEQRGLTIKQWMVLAAIGNLDGEPSLSEIASYLGMTHQNIKQLCLQLERKGYVTLDKNGQDRRIVRVVTTEKNKKEWDRFEEEDMAFIASLFSPFESEEYMRLDMLVEKLRTHLTMLVERADGP